MFDGLLRFLTGVDDGRQSGEQDNATFALAVLLIEVARSDDRVEVRERGIIERALALRFGLDRSEVTRLMKAAEEGAIKATDLHHFTQTVVRQFSEEERIGVIEMLWEVAYSDGLLTGDEDALIRRVAGLLYVSDWERGEAKRRITQRSEGCRHQ
jgi:uncharacterized tellurite resistance protein B-like protein